MDCVDNQWPLKLLCTGPTVVDVLRQHCGHLLLRGLLWDRPRAHPLVHRGRALQSRPRPAAMAVAGFSNWSANFLVGMGFQYVEVHGDSSIYTLIDWWLDWMIDRRVLNPISNVDGLNIYQVFGFILCLALLSSVQKSYKQTLPSKVHSTINSTIEKQIVVNACFCILAEPTFFSNNLKVPWYGNFTSWGFLTLIWVPLACLWSPSS